MPVLDRPGARVHYDVAGDGPALVLGHSLLCDGRMWDALAPRLAEGYRTVVVDARGHRRSSADRRFTLEDLADDWLAILDREGIARAALCGLSMGGMTAMRVALRAPERVAGLALLDTSADAEPASRRLEYRAMAELLRWFGHLDALYRTVPKLMFGRTTRRERPELVAREVAHMREHAPRALYHAARAVLGRGPLGRDRLGAIACPVAVVVGDEDVATPPARSERIAAAIPGGALHRIARAGHLTAVEAPDAVLAILRGWLAGCRWS